MAAELAVVDGETVAERNMVLTKSDNHSILAVEPVKFDDPLEICLFGEFRILRNGLSLPSPTLKKARVLLARLSLWPEHSFIRDEVAAHLWPDAEMHSARFNLRQLLARIRKATPELSPCLVSEDRKTIRLVGVRVDALEFKRLANSEPERAIELYRGHLLEGLDDEWLGPPRSEYQALYFRTVEELTVETDPRAAVAVLRRALKLDPFRETLQQNLMLRLAECGDLTGAQAAYRQFAELLHREMNLEPSAETARLNRELLGTPVIPKSPPVPIPPMRSRLPVPPNNIVGRERELEEIQRLLDSCRLLTLLGPGGVGKTRLAIAVGDRLVMSRPSGVWFVDLYSVVDPSQVLPAVAQVLGLRESSGVGWADVTIEHIAASEPILVLDNCEHLLEACAETAGLLLERCPGLRILATSRAPLNTGAEQRYEVLALTVPDGQEGGQFSALELFEARAKQVHPSFTVGTENRQDVVRICREVDGLPLAIEMAAARLSALSLREISRRLGDSAAFLRLSSREAPKRHQTLHSVVQWSFDLLSPRAKILVRRLAVFRGSWTVAGMEAVCAFGELRPAEALEALFELAEASLVQLNHDRYRFLESVRHFAAERLHESTDACAVQDAHLVYFAAFCEDADSRVSTLGPDRAAEHYGPDLFNIRAALTWSVESGNAVLGLKLVKGASLAMSALQLDREAGDWVLRALRAFQGDGRLAALLCACRFLTSNHANLDQVVAGKSALLACHEAIELATTQGDQQALADALCHMAEIEYVPHEEVAQQAVRRATEINLRLPNEGNLRRPLTVMGLWASTKGCYEDAQALFEQAAVQARRAGDNRLLILALASQSHLAREQCDYDFAEQKLLETAKVLSLWRDARAEAFNNLRLAELYVDQWRFSEMKAPLMHAKSFYDAMGSGFHQLLVDGLSRYVAAFEGDVQAALKDASIALSRALAGAAHSSWAWWHALGIELEALALAIHGAGLDHDAARLLGAAQAMRERDLAFLSPGVRARWKLFADRAGLAAYEEQVMEGHSLNPERAVQLAESVEKRLLGEAPGAVQVTA